MTLVPVVTVETVVTEVTVLTEGTALISFSILGVKWYGKPYYFGNAGYAFPYLLEATT